MNEQLLRDLFEEERTHWWHAAKRELILAFIPSQNRRVLVLGVGGGSPDVADRVPCRHVASPEP